jgi:hypothetical protein
VLPRAHAGGMPEFVPTDEQRDIVTVRHRLKRRYVLPFFKS